MTEPRAKKKILIVDDEPGVVSYLEMLFQDDGYETSSARDGREAMELAKREKPDLVTLDISMPEASGARFYKELRSDPELAATPVVIITAITGIDGDPYAYKKFISGRRTIRPPEGFFPKPIVKDELMESIRQLLS